MEEVPFLLGFKVSGFQCFRGKIKGEDGATETYGPFLSRLACLAESQTLAVRVYRNTESFPRSEIYGLTSQLRRAGISVASNIAEGQDDSPWENSNISSVRQGGHSWNWKPNSISLQSLVTSIASLSKAC